MKFSKGVLVQAYVLHVSKYRDTSLIADLYSRENGRFSVIVKGARSKKSRYRGLIEAFTPLMLSISGKSDLKLVTGIEFPKKPFSISGRNLFVALYVNELLFRLLEKFDPLECLFDAYEKLLTDFEKSEDITQSLRQFEIDLLRELGYGINFYSEANAQEEIVPESYYRFVVNEGFHIAEESSEMRFLGREIRNIASGKLEKVEASKLRFLTRSSLAILLGDKRLTSREIFSGVVK